MSVTKDQITRAIKSLPKLAEPVEIGMILGTGLGGLTDAVDIEETIPYSRIEGLQSSTAPSHAGQLVIGRYQGRRIAVMQGRIHLYEGYSASEVVFPVYILRALGAKTFVVTNAAGGLNESYSPGDVMVIGDHLNLSGRNPLIGENDDAIGVRFPDMSRAYDPGLLERAQAAAKSAGVSVHTGVYASVTGPSLETSAERRYIRSIGGDAIGMSTVLEVIAANHCGLKVLGFSAITNVATGGAGQPEDSIEDRLENAKICGAKLERILQGVAGDL